VGEHLPSKSTSLSSNPTTAKHQAKIKSSSKKRGVTSSLRSRNRNNCQIIILVKISIMLIQLQPPGKFIAICKPLRRWLIEHGTHDLFNITFLAKILAFRRHLINVS
jgi:hypothetical protein